MAGVLLSADQPTEDAPLGQSAAVTATRTATAMAETRTGGSGSTPSVNRRGRRGVLPDRIGDWHIIDRLGEGGMGEVFHVAHLDGRPAALKRASSHSRSRVEALRREADALEALAQPGVARLIDRGEQDGLPWYAMDFVDGPTLGGYVVGRSLAERLPVLVELCVILDRLHRAGGVHRDVKPANVLVADGAPVLIDFGLLVRIGGGRGQPGWARDKVHAAPPQAGTAGYLAPEQRRGGWCDGRTDLYAVGRMLTEWMAATGETLPGLEPLVKTLLADAPAGRPRDGAVVARRLARIAGLEPPAIEADGTALHRAPSVGRSAELAIIDAAIERARDGRGGVIVLSGPSGIGKSRLALEAVRRADGFRAVVGECRAVSGGLLHGFDAVLRHAVDRCRGNVGRTLAVFGDHGSTLSPFAPSVGDLPGQTGGLPAPSAAKVSAAIRHTVTALAEMRPLLVVVDDVQWADRLTGLALEAVADDPGGALVVLTARTDLPAEVIEPLRGRDAVQWIRLDPLSAADAGALVGQLIGEVDPEPALVRAVVRQAEGNPFFVAECLRAMLADGRLQANDAGWRFTGGDGSGALPVPAETVIRARLDRLSDSGRALIEALAVLGREAPLDRLAIVLDRLPETTALDEVVRRSICDRVDGALRFAHDRLLAVTRDGIAPDNRTTLHARAAADLRDRPPTDAYVGARSLAFHLAAAGEPIAAARALARAGDLAEQRGAVDDAAACFAEAADGLDGREAIEARVAQARCLAAGGRYREAADTYQLAADAARAADEAALEATACSAMGLTLVMVDRVDDAEPVLRRAIELLEDLGDDAARATACTRLATVQVHRGRWDEVDALQREALAIQLEADDPVEIARTLNNMALVADTREQHDEALDLVTRAYTAARDHAQPSMALGIRMHRAQLLHRAGVLDEAKRELDASITGLDEARMATQLGWALVGRATLMRHMGPDPAPGWHDLDRAEAIFADFDYAICHATLACERAHHLLATGQDADAAVDRALAQAARSGVDPSTPSVIGRALAGLLEARSRRARGGDEGLFRGQVWHRIFPGVRAWLTARGDGPR